MFNQERKMTTHMMEGGRNTVKIRGSKKTSVHISLKILTRYTKNGEQPNEENGRQKIDQEI